MERITKVVFNGSLKTEILKYLKMWRNVEVGGLLIGSERNNELVISFAYFPSQIEQTRTTCTFGRGFFWARKLIELINDQMTSADFNIVGWIHSHPNLGAFLSGTDLSTLKSFPVKRFLATVIDPFREEFKNFWSLKKETKKADKKKSKIIEIPEKEVIERQATNDDLDRIIDLAHRFVLNRDETLITYNPKIRVYGKIQAPSVTPTIYDIDDFIMEMEYKIKVLKQIIKENKKNIKQLDERIKSSSS
ncbi:MAG: hypothetical protein GF308_18990 [Candidatus Heimdallarchaeota archaeon]|nr:hypothetical protein [Candidatus Heimdallarchaeota archaeon]